jgi:hypothetical protein
MTEPNRPRPVPGPPRPGGAPAPGAGAVGPAAVPGGGHEAAPGTSPLAGLDRRPVTEHVAAFEAEYQRLERELATIDRL